jgi:predicted nucleic acid-binding protein
MPLVSNIIISDTSCLILLDKIGELSLLKSLSNKVYVTSVILEEYGKQLPNWILIRDPDNKHYQRIFEMDLDRGEASAIALCIEDTQAILIKRKKCCRKVKH